MLRYVKKELLIIDVAWESNDRQEEVDEVPDIRLIVVLLQHLQAFEESLVLMFVHTLELGVFLLEELVQNKLLVLKVWGSNSDARHPSVILDDEIDTCHRLRWLDELQDLRPLLVDDAQHIR